MERKTNEEWNQEFEKKIRDLPESTKEDMRLVHNFIGKIIDNAAKEVEARAVDNEKLRQEQQRERVIKEVVNEVRIVGDDIQKVIDIFKDRILKYKRFQNIELSDIKELQKTIKYLSKSVKQFFDWFKFWKAKGFCDKE